VSHDEALGLTARKRKVDIREEYFVCADPAPLTVLTVRHLQRIQSTKDDDWDIVRVPRPKGVPEWGAPPEERTSVPAERLPPRWFKVRMDACAKALLRFGSESVIDDEHEY
jgi:hypothetical protein